MARPAAALRVHDFDPDSVALEVVERYVEHARDVAYYLAPVAACRAATGDLLRTPLAQKVRALVLFAQASGAATGPDNQAGFDAIAEIHGVICPCLDATPDALQAVPKGVFDALPADRMRLVFLAAYARWKLGEPGSKLSARELAVLAGVDPNHIRLLARQRKLPLKDGKVSRAAALAWLSGRPMPSPRALSARARPARARRPSTRSRARRDATTVR